ncbi:hypothetical protein MBLNU457_1826t1 [Dothideomycetes sp. NU457]
MFVNTRSYSYPAQKEKEMEKEARRAWSPSKDGFSKSTRSRKFDDIVKVICVVLLVTLCYVVVFPQAPSAKDMLKPAAPAIVDTPSPASAASGSAYSRSRQQAVMGFQAEDKTREHHVADTSKSDSNTRVAKDNYQTVDAIHIARSLRRVIDLIPDELRVADLLRPITTSGEARMRDLGLRTRALKKLWDAWESLHVIEGPNGASTRSDILQVIRSIPEIANFDEGVAGTIRSYETFRHLFQKLTNIMYPYFSPFTPDLVSMRASFKHAGRGLVFTAGDGQAPFLMTSIPTIRKLGCDLPIEIMYLGEDDLSSDVREALEGMPGVTTRDLSPMISDEGWKLAGWAAKPYTILMSSFREVIFVDADSFFFVDPTSFFEDPAYINTGALFFRDRRIFPEDRRPFLKRILPQPISKKAQSSRFWTGESGHMQEAGVVVVDKYIHFVSLLLVTRMNGPDRDGNKDKEITGTYDLVYGDKETFWLGFELAGDTSYNFHGGDCGMMGKVKGNSTGPSTTKQYNTGPTKSAVYEDEDEEPLHDETSSHHVARATNYTMCAPQLLHLDLEGRPLWFNGWLAKNKFSDRKKQEYASFDHYMIERTDLREPGVWDMGESNTCCLTADAVLTFNEGERGVIDMIMSTAREKKALGV